MGENRKGAAVGLAPPDPIDKIQELTREEINRLPLRRYQGEIRVVQSAEEAAEALRALKKDGVLGFDTETRPAFRKGTYFQPALVQLAGSSGVVIFQIRSSGFLEGIREVLADESILKVGVGLDFDLQELVKLTEFEPSGFFDLSRAARRRGLKKVGLRPLAAVLLGFRISKGAKCSNWAAPQLRPSQIRYAATDAWVSREIFLAMQERGWIFRRRHEHF